MKKLAFIAVVLDGAGSISLMEKYAGAVAGFVAENNYGVGRASEWNQLFCAAFEELPGLEQAYDAFKLDSIEGDKKAIRLLNEIPQENAVKSLLYARIYLHGYTHRDYFYGKKDEFLDAGLDNLITAWSEGMTVGRLLPNWYVNRLLSCLTEEQEDSL